MVSPAQDNLPRVSYSQQLLDAFCQPWAFTHRSTPSSSPCLHSLDKYKFTSMYKHYWWHGQTSPHVWGERTSVNLGRWRGTGSSDSPVEVSPWIRPASPILCVKWSRAGVWAPVNQPGVLVLWSSLNCLGKRWIKRKQDFPFFFFSYQLKELGIS